MSFRSQLTPGTVLGRYELLLPVAQGGMACVWAARLTGSRGFAKTVAVKTMLPLLSDDPAFEEMFLQEAEVASRIHHPNVATILDLGEQDETLFLVMEWVDGEPLSVVLKTARKNGVQVPMRVTLRIATQICAGLHAAHELRDDSDQPMGLVHRDVSPQNILLNRDGLVKLVDFGIAKAVSRAGAETGAGTVKGKVPYLSPEQIRGKAVDRRADVFALGVILYRMTTGSHPFLGDTDSHTMRNTVSRPVLPPHVKHPSFCRPLEKVILRCLQKEPEKRFETMAAVERALEEVMLSEVGALVPFEEVTSFVRGLLGERENRRRIALRDAARAIDDRVPIGEDIFEIPDEDVSGLLLTDTMTPTTGSSSVPSDVHSTDGGWRESSPSLDAVAGSAGPSGTPATNLTAAMAPSDVTPRAPRRRGLAWLLAGAAALGGLALGVLHLTRELAPPSHAVGAEGRIDDADAAPPPSDELGSGTRADARGVRFDDLPSDLATATADSLAVGKAPPSTVRRSPSPAVREAPSDAAVDAASPSDAPREAPSPDPATALPPKSAGDSPPQPSGSVAPPWVPTVQDPGF